MWLVRWPEIGGGRTDEEGSEEGDRRIGGEFQRAARRPGDLLAEWLMRL